MSCHAAVLKHHECDSIRLNCIKRLCTCTHILHTFLSCDNPPLWKYNNATLSICIHGNANATLLENFKKAGLYIIGCVSLFQLIVSEATELDIRISDKVKIYLLSEEGVLGENPQKGFILP